MDTYGSYRELAGREQEGVDYSVRFREVLGAVAVVAPHGGCIEPGTSELADAVAGPELSFYAFEGLKPKRNNRLHITSTRFDEPRCLALIEKAGGVIAVHGEASRAQAVFIGGRNHGMRGRLVRALTARGFPVKVHSNPALQGMDPLNICNRCGDEGGAQLELSSGFRRILFEDLSGCGRTRTTQRFAEFVAAVRAGINGSFLPA